ncbi:MAG: diacylglycerol kinase family protein [Spirochaetia bacterium]|nr:diacylglycerol kinase family protein [Spirochaetia bacterium]
MKKNLILFNPSSGQSRSLNSKEYLEQILVKHNVNYELIVTESEDHLRQQIRKNLLKSKVKQLNSISTAGGDSTFTILINEMIRARVNVPVCVIPLGSSDDIAREMKMYSVEDSVTAISRGISKKMDVGKISGKNGFSYYFPGQANVGIGVFVNRYVSNFQKSSHVFRKNQLIAGVSGMYNAFFTKFLPIKFTISYVDINTKKTIELFDDYISLLFSKIRFWSTGRLFLPDAKIDDGKLHLLMIRNCGFLKTLQIMLKASNGSHIDQKKVQYMASHLFHLSSKQPFMIQVDGDIITEFAAEKQFTSITIEALKNRIDIISL